MKFMRKYICLAASLFGALSIASCKDDEVAPEINDNQEIVIPEPVAPVLVQTLYFDFGPNDVENRGDITASPDVNGNYWNNITNNSGNYASVGTSYEGLVNSANIQTEYALTLNTRFSTNGKSGGGGLLEPQADLLNDFAIPTATEDYFYIESNENNSL